MKHVIGSLFSVVFLAGCLEKEPCQLILSPLPVFEAPTKAAAERWQKAAGCLIGIQPGGIPVRWDDENQLGDSRALTHFDKDGEPAYIAYKNGANIPDDPLKPSWKVASSSIAHEIGHVLGVWEHIPNSLMAGEGRHIDDKITMEVLDVVCEYSNCAWMMAE